MGVGIAYVWGKEGDDSRKVRVNVVALVTRTGGKVEGGWGRSYFVDTKLSLGRGSNGRAAYSLSPNSRVSSLTSSKDMCSLQEFVVRSITESLAFAYSQLAVLLRSRAGAASP